ncbi:hypothetical protein J6590_095912 [Homalodisca vitripennis]|nr:hypothetical protein J6590_095912 [Homalodisca vitripennis]
MTVQARCLQGQDRSAVTHPRAATSIPVDMVKVTQSVQMLFIDYYIKNKPYEGLSQISQLMSFIVLSENMDNDMQNVLTECGTMKGAVGMQYDGHKLAGSGRH